MSELEELKRDLISGISNLIHEIEVLADEDPDSDIFWVVHSELKHALAVTRNA